jgi:hypothetical protein
MILRLTLAIERAPKPVKDGGRNASRCPINRIIQSL